MHQVDRLLDLQKRATDQFNLCTILNVHSYMHRMMSIFKRYSSISLKTTMHSTFDLSFKAYLVDQERREFKDNVLVQPRKEVLAFRDHVVQMDAKVKWV